jgi:alanyl-tRNA synthetase
MIKANELKEKYLSFFEKKGHKRLANASLIPENDPTALFINSGMHPLVPYLLGEPHPLGKRLTSNQRCLRTDDLEIVGDHCHHTFFEMLGNWSLGDYWKKEAISFSWEFLTKELAIEPKRISVTCFAGDRDAPKDEEAARVWQGLGIPKERIYFLGKKDNWWTVGKTGPCGPDTEMFYETGKEKCSPDCRPGCDCDKYVEIWNDVFMEYRRQANGKLENLKQQNIDTGMGVERTVAVLNGFDDNYQTELFAPIIKMIEKLTVKKYQGQNLEAMRVIADHLRAATFLIADGVFPGNLDQGYILRRLIRRAVRFGRTLQLIKPLNQPLAKVVIQTYKQVYPYLEKQRQIIIDQLIGEEKKFSEAIKRGKKEFEKMISKKKRILSGQEAFFLYETYGLPWEMITDLAGEKKIKLEKKSFDRALAEHQRKSRWGAEKKFKGGLADHSRTVTRLHTATHLLHWALRAVLGNHVRQIGSNITPERLRFDFAHPGKLTKAQIEKVNRIINDKIDQALPVKMEMMNLEQARGKNALAFFDQKYSQKVKVYSIKDCSCEVCGGPHVENTREIGHIRIKKEESIGAGRRRIYAVLEGENGS